MSDVWRCQSAYANVSQLCFCTRSKNKEGTMYLALKSLKYAVKKVNNGQKAKSKVQIMIFEVKMRG